MSADPMAKVCYDFPSTGKYRITGEVTVRSAADARPIVDRLNAEFGEGSHWIETLNYTYEEFLEQQRRGD